MTALRPSSAALPALRADRRLLIALALIVLVAFGVRLATIKATNSVPRTDAADYDRHALSLVEHHTYPPSIVTGGRGASAYRPPAYPFVLAGVYELSGTGSPSARWRAARVFEALLGALAVGLIAVIALQVAGPLVALIASGIAAVYPPLVAVNTSLMSEALYIPLELAAVACVLAHRRSTHRWRWLLAAAALAGLTALTRSNAILLIPALAVGIWRPPRRSVKSLVPVAVFLAVGAAVIAPWTARNAVALHSFVPITTQTGFGLAGQYNDEARDDPRYPSVWRAPYVPEYAPLLARRDLTEADVDRRLRARVRHFIADDPAYVLRAGWWNTIYMLNLHDHYLEHVSAHDFGVPDGLVDPEIYAFYLVGLLALAGAFTPLARRVPGFVWLVPASVFLSAMFISGLTRYRVPADPFVILLAAIAVASLIQRRRTGTWASERPDAP